MSFKSSLGLVAAEPTAEVELRRLRVEAARANAQWQEVDDDFVRRGPFLVSASTDRCFVPFRGQIFTESHPRPSFNEAVPLSFYVSDDRLYFIEAKGTWTELVEKRERRGR